jgi:uncharacterized protein (TIGR02246 family)
MFAFIAFACGGLSMSNANAADPSPVKVAEEMVQAWNELNVDKIVNTFSEDGVLHSVMLEPVTGRKAIRERLTGFLAGATRLELRLKNVAVVGNTVFLERVDDFDFKGKHGSVPVVGVMDISGGKVKAWREYYDHASLMREMGIAPAKH